MRSFSLYPVLLLLVFAIIPLQDASSSGADTVASAVVHGRVTDVEGAPVRGAMVFAYKSRDVWRSADFISAPADADGLFRMLMPPGRYWMVARFKRTEGFGPLLQGDKHSGDPVETDLTAPGAVNMDFIVADLKDAIRMKKEALERPVRIRGRIIDEKGESVTRAYVIAYRQEISRIPDFLSAWVDAEGRYTLYLPAGKYIIGAAGTFPPGDDYSIHGEMALDADRSDVAVVFEKAGNGH